MSDRNIVVNFHKNNREVIWAKDKSLKSKDCRAAMKNVGSFFCVLAIDGCDSSYPYGKCLFQKLFIRIFQNRHLLYGDFIQFYQSF